MDDSHTLTSCALKALTHEVGSMADAIDDLFCGTGTTDASLERLRRARDEIRWLGGQL